MGKYIRIALRNLLQARRRSLLLAIALATVTMLLVLLTSLSEGIRDNLIRTATNISTGHVNVTGFYKTSQGDAAPLLTDASRVRAILEEEISGVEYIVDRQNGWGRAVSASSSIQTVFKGIDIAAEQRFLDVLQLAPESSYVEGGRDEVLGDPTRLAEPNTVLLFAGQAERLGVTVGDALTIKALTFSGVSNTGEVTVVAVVKDMGLLSSFHAFVSRRTLLDIYQLKDDTSGSVMIYLDDIDQAEDKMEEIRAVLAKHDYALMDYDPRPYFMKFESVMGEDWTGQKLDLTTWKDETSLMAWILTAVDTITFILVTVLTVIIIIGIMNTMWIAVRERTREVGTLRAIGMGKRQVLLLFMTEAMLLGVVATGVGGAVGAGLALAIDAAEVVVPIDALTVILMSDTIHLTVQFGDVLFAIGMFTLITALSAAWPSSRAARMQPVTAIHHIE